MAAKAPDQIITEKGGILGAAPAIAWGAAKSGAWVAGGFLAAELGTIGLRSTLGAVEKFAAGSMPKAAFTRFGVGTVATAGVGFFLLSGKVDRAARIGAFKRCALMELGVGVSALREYVAMAVLKASAKIQSFTVARGGGTFSPSYTNVLSLPTRRAGGTVYGNPGGTVARYGGIGTDTTRQLRAGGDAGFSVPTFIDPSRITKTEVGL